MKTEASETPKTTNPAPCLSLAVSCMVTSALHLGLLGAFGQTSKYLYTGSKVSIPLYAGTYNITAYGAKGGVGGDSSSGGLGAKMEGQFLFGTATTLTILVGGTGVTGGGAGGGGGGTFILAGSTPLVIAGGGGGTSVSKNGRPGLTGTSGGSAGGGAPGGADGNGGGGGGYYFGAGGGGGYLGNGIDSAYPGGYGGSSYLSGGGGGVDAGGNSGGYGGGGSGGNSGGGGGGYSGGGGGAGTGGGGGGGSYIGPSAIAVVDSISGVVSPDGAPNGEVIITAVQVPRPRPLPIYVSQSGQTNTVYWKNEFGWSLQQSSNLTNWITKTTSITTLNGTNYLTQLSSKTKLFFRLSY